MHWRSSGTIVSDGSSEGETFDAGRSAIAFKSQVGDDLEGDAVEAKIVVQTSSTVDLEVIVEARRRHRRRRRSNRGSVGIRLEVAAALELKEREREREDLREREDRDVANKAEEHKRSKRGEILKEKESIWRKERHQEIGQELSVNFDRGL
ncbi:hypothetical protein ACLB2K_034752 [Fragaria x ananassa]